MLLWSLPALSFDPAHLKRLLEDNRCEHCDLQQAPLGRLDLSAAKLTHANLSAADLSGTNLQWADLSFANLERVRLEQTDLSATSMYRANLKNTDLTEARLAGADLREANLTHLNIDLDLEFIELTGVLLEGARFQFGQRCAAFPDKGGWGCAASTTINSEGVNE